MFITLCLLLGAICFLSFVIMLAMSDENNNNSAIFGIIFAVSLFLLITFNILEHESSAVNKLRVYHITESSVSFVDDIHSKTYISDRYNIVTMAKDTTHRICIINKVSVFLNFKDTSYNLNENNIFICKDK
jgi:uncharacterized membrane protein